MGIDEKMIEAVNSLMEVHNEDRIFTRQELIRLIHDQFGIHEASIIPSDYCYNRTNYGIDNSKPKLFLHVGRGLYRCVGQAYTYDGPVQHDVRRREQRSIHNKRSASKTPLDIGIDATKTAVQKTQTTQINSVDILSNACEDLFDLSHAKLSEAYYYSALPLCVIDAVFSIGVTYTSTQNTVLRYCDYLNLSPYNRKRNDASPKHTITNLIGTLETVGIVESATKIFQNHQRTSPLNGILKAEAVYHFAKVLQQNRIEAFSDLNTINDFSTIQRCIQQIPGQRSGLSWQYFLMLAGDDKLSKPDRHILRFIERYLGFRPSMSEAQQILTDTVNALSIRYPDLSVRLLDYMIWDASAHNKL